jgi:hypothetical protein
MTIAHVTTANGQLLELAAGVTVGHVLVRHHSVVIDGDVAGETSSRATLQADGQFNTLFVCPFPVQTPDGQPVGTLTIRNCTLDGASISTLVGVVGGTVAAGPVRIVLDNVVIVDHHRNTTAVLNAGELDAGGLSIYGNGGGVLSDLTSTVTRLRDVSIVGGKFGYAIADEDGGDPGVVPGVDIDGLNIILDYWANPSYEAVEVTGYGPIYADVAGHVAADRSLYDVLRALTLLGTFAADDPAPIVPLARPWDRVEVADGRWSQVLGVSPSTGALRLDTWRAAGSWTPVATPSGTASCWRVSLGRYMGELQANRLALQTGGGIPGYALWRGVAGGLAQPEFGAGSRLDIIRHGLTNPSVRDVDTGAVHVTKSGLNARLRRLRARGSFSDVYSFRGVGTQVYDARARLNQDMAFTVDGEHDRQQLDLCVAEYAGFHGFILLHGPSDLRGGRANDCGTHGHGYGVVVEAEALGSTVDIRGARNTTEFMSAPWLAYGQHARALTDLARSPR